MSTSSESKEGSLATRLDVVPRRLTSPSLDPMDCALAPVAAEVESHVRRVSRRNWRRNDAMSRGAESSESPFVVRRVTKRLRIDGTLQASSLEAPSEYLGVRTTGLLDEGIEANEIVFIDSKGDHAGLRLPSLVPLHLAASCSASRRSVATTAKIKPDSSIARLSANSGSPCST